MTTRNIIQQRIRAVYTRELAAWLEIALCASWLAQFGPAEDVVTHQLIADHANNEATRVAARIEAMEAGDAHAD